MKQRANMTKDAPQILDGGSAVLLPAAQALAPPHAWRSDLPRPPATRPRRRGARVVPATHRGGGGNFLARVIAATMGDTSTVEIPHMR